MVVASDVYHAPESHYVAALSPLRSASGRAHISLIVRASSKYGVMMNAS